MPSKRIINSVVQAVCSLPGWRGSRVLDLSCGDGEVIEALGKEGCKPEGTHFLQKDYIYKKPAPSLSTAKIHEGIDLCKRLPFADSEYDIVMATEVIEHLSSHVVLCSEAGRVLKPGGYFILTTPNIQRLSSRLKFFLAGQHELRSARLGWDIPAGDLYSTHYNPVYFPVMHTLLHHNNLHIEKLVFTTLKPLSLLLLALYPFVLVATVIEARHAIKRSGAGGRDLLRWMLDWRMLFSDQLMLVARKDPSGKA